MKTIWKFKLEITDKQTLTVPSYFMPLHVGFQGNELFVWAMVDTESLKKEKSFFIYGTGHSLPEKAGLHIGTTFSPNGIFVWHIFEDGKR